MITTDTINTDESPDVPGLKISLPRSRLRLPKVLPRKSRTQGLSSTSIKVPDKKHETAPKLMEEFQSLFSDPDDLKYIYSERIVNGIRKIGSQLGDDEAFYLLSFLLHKIERAYIASQKEEEKEKENPRYWWRTLFYCLEYLSPSFFNGNIDITALIFLKCYEFLTLKTDDDDRSLHNLQETLEELTDSLVKKIDRNNRVTLVNEILAGNLPCSTLHQYDSVSLDHYLLKMKN